MKDKVRGWTERKRLNGTESIQLPHSRDVGKALATDLKQTADVSHKHQDVLQAGFFLTVIHTVPSLS